MIQPGTRCNPALALRLLIGEIRGRPAPRGVVGYILYSADVIFCIIHIPLVIPLLSWNRLFFVSFISHS